MQHPSLFLLKKSVGYEGKAPRLMNPCHNRKDTEALKMITDEKFKLSSRRKTKSS